MVLLQNSCNSNHNTPGGVQVTPAATFSAASKAVTVSCCTVRGSKYCESLQLKVTTAEDWELQTVVPEGLTLSNG